MSVQRCICHNVPFTTVVALRDQGLNFVAIRERTRCCTGCTLCEPYVRLAIETGRTSFAPLSPVEAAQIMARAVPTPTTR